MAFLKSPFWGAVGILCGMIIGSGMFALPFAVNVSGILPSIIAAGIAFFLVLSMHLAYGEIVVNTWERHRLPGYAGLYLGRWGNWLAKISQTLGFNTALVIYASLAGIFLVTIFGGDRFLWSILFLFIMSLVLFFEPVSGIGKINIIFVISIVFVTLIISGFAFGSGTFENLSNTAFVGKDPFFAFGVFVFALTGLSVIADARDIFGGKDAHKLRKVIFVGTSVPFFLYIIFIAAVLMAIDGKVTQNVIQSMAEVLGRNAVILGATVGVMAMFSAFLALGYDLKEIYELDVGVSKNSSWALATIIPIIIFTLGAGDFIKLMSLMGGIFISIDGFLVLAILNRLQKSGVLMLSFTRFGKIHKFALAGILLLSISYEVFYQIF
ncbi:amino acid permease [Candidatus Giovannonibacteria bacterium]|nr:amino acid permease [Candidatus Giovannonibacteria bacterium]